MITMRIADWRDEKRTCKRISEEILSISKTMKEMKERLVTSLGTSFLSEMIPGSFLLRVILNKYSSWKIHGTFSPSRQQEMRLTLPWKSQRWRKESTNSPSDSFLCHSQFLLLLRCVSFSRDSHFRETLLESLFHICCHQLKHVVRLKEMCAIECGAPSFTQY
jgi:hypothetical protein